MTLRLTYQSLLGLSLSFASVSAFASARPVPPEQMHPASQVEEEVPVSEKVERSRQWVVDRIDGLSEGLDVFFVQNFFNESVIEDDIGESRAVIAFNTRREFGGEVDYKFTGRLKLELPNTNRRLKLIVASEDDSEYSIEKQPIQNLENATYTTAIRVILNERSAWDTDIDFGMRGGFPLNPYSRVRARRYDQIFSWKNRFTQTFYYTNLEGWGETTELRFDKSLTSKHLLVFNTEADYLLQDNFFEVSSDINLYHKINEATLLSYQMGALGDTDKGSVVSSYYAGIKYRKLIYKDWVYAGVNPQIEWDKDRDYKRMWVLMFSFEAVFSSQLN